MELKKEDLNVEDLIKDGSKDTISTLTSSTTKTSEGAEGTGKVDLNAFEALKGGEVNVDEETKRVAQEVKEKLAEEEKKATESKEEEKEEKEEVEEKEEEVDLSKLTPAQITAKKFLKESTPDEKKTSLEYTPDEVATTFLKKMSSDAQQWVKAELKRANDQKVELETLKQSFKETKEAPLSWYEHENGYVLDESYQSALTSSNRINGLINHYENQLVSIREGEKSWEALQVDAQGQIIKVAVPADTRSEIMIQRSIQELTNAKAQHELRAQSIQGEFKGKVSNAKNIITTIEDEYFPQYKGEEPLKTNRYLKEFNEMLSSRSLKKDLLAGISTKLYAVYRETLDELMETKKQLKGKKFSDEIQQSAGLPADSITTTGGKSTPKDPNKVTYDADAFAKLKEMAS